LLKEREEKTGGSKSKVVADSIKIIERIRNRNKSGFINLRLVVLTFIITSLLLFAFKTNKTNVPVIASYTKLIGPVKEELSITPSIVSAGSSSTGLITSILNKIHGLESTWGKALSGHHIYCRNLGLWNEYGYDPAGKFCFKDKDDADQILIENFTGQISKGWTEAKILCYYNTGYKLDDCEYYRKSLTIK
jgi:hypothetical protein